MAGYDEELQFARTPAGKPWLAAHAWLHFNLSHSGTLAAVALSSKYPVGVDIENVTGKAEVKRRVADRFFHPAERAWLEAQTDDDLLHFTTLWSLKEAWLKMSGAGLAQPLSSFYVLPGEGGQESVGVKGLRLDWHIIRLCRKIVVTVWHSLQIERWKTRRYAGGLFFSGEM